MLIVRAATLLTPKSVQSRNKKNRYNKVTVENKCHCLKPDDGGVPVRLYSWKIICYSNQGTTTNASFKTDLIWPNETDRLKKTSENIRYREGTEISYKCYSEAADICCITGPFGLSEFTGGLYIWTAMPEQACIKRDHDIIEV